MHREEVLGREQQPPSNSVPGTQEAGVGFEWVEARDGDILVSLAAWQRAAPYQEEHAQEPDLAARIRDAAVAAYDLCAPVFGFVHNLDADADP